MTNVQSFDDPHRFLEYAEAFLLQNEPAHNLLLGIAYALARQSAHEGCRPYLAVVADDGATSGAALRTPPFNLVISQLANHVALLPLARDIHVRYATLPGVLGPAAVAREFCRAWREVSGQDSRLAVALRVFRLEAVSHVHGVPGRPRRAMIGDRDLLITWFAAFHAEALAAVSRKEVVREVDAYLSDESQHLYLWEDEDHPVAVAGARAPTAHGIRIGPVYTPPESRRRGYASALVAALGQAMLDAGYQFCTLFTDLANPTPNHIYQDIGFRPVCDMDEYAFT